MKAQLILASASPRRRKILDTLGLSYEVVVPDADEVLYVDDPLRTATENAQMKSDWYVRTHSIGMADILAPCAVITADTVIDFHGRIVTKPASMEQAAEFFWGFSGSSHTVITAVVLAETDKASRSAVSKSVVTFKELTDKRISSYLSGARPLDKAGGYDIDYEGDSIIESFSGSRTNIMGLPSEVISSWFKV